MTKNQIIINFITKSFCRTSLPELLDQFCPIARERNFPDDYPLCMSGIDINRMLSRPARHENLKAAWIRKQGHAPPARRVDQL